MPVINNSACTSVGGRQACTSVGIAPAWYVHPAHIACTPCLFVLSIAWPSSYIVLHFSTLFRNEFTIFVWFGTKNSNYDKHSLHLAHTAAWQYICTTSATSAPRRHHVGTTSAGRLHTAQEHDRHNQIVWYIDRETLWSVRHCTMQRVYSMTSVAKAQQCDISVKGTPVWHQC